MQMVLNILVLVLAIVLTGLVVIQPSKGDGLGSIGGGGQMFFSKNKGFEALLEKTTAWLAVFFAIFVIWAGLLS